MEKSIQILITIMILVFLGVSAYCDCRWKRIPWCVQGMGFIFVCISIIVQWKESYNNFFLAIVPGVFLLFLAWVTKENIGYGDGISVLLLGGMAGLRNCIWVLCFSLILLSITGLVLLVIKRVNRKTKIPYLPFLFVAESLLVLFRNL